MKHFYFSLFFSTLFILSQAQKTSNLSPEYDWVTYRMGHNGSEYNQFSSSYSQFILSLGEKEKVIPVQIGKEVWAVTKVNDQGKALWQTRTPGEIRGIGKFGENILAVCVDDYMKTGIVTASLINSISGKELQKKVIYRNTSEYQLEIKVQNKPDGNFTGVLIRTTNHKAGFKLRDSKEDQVSSNKMEMISLDENLLAKVFVLKTSVFTNTFCGSITNKAGDLFICGANDENLYLFQFGGDGLEKTKLSTSLSHNGFFISCMLQADEFNENNIFVSAIYSPSKKDYSFRLFSFDFGSKKVVSSDEQPLNKTYEKSLKLEHVKGTYSGDARPIERLETAGIIPWRNGVALLSEIRTENTDTKTYTTRYYNNAWILSVYDRDLRLEKTIGLDKSFEVFVWVGRSIGYQLKNDQLYIACPVLSGIAKYSTLLSKVNLSAGTIEIQNLDRDDINRTYFIEAGATLWFDKSFLLQYIVPQKKFLSAMERHSMFQTVAF